MIYTYLILSVILVLISNNFFEIFCREYSWWLVPLLVLAFFLAMLILHFIWFLLSFAFVNVNSNQERGARYYRFVLKSTLPLLLTLARVKINLSGLPPESVPTDREMLFVCNHQHDFDPIIIWSVFPNNNIGFIGKKEIYKTMPLIGKIMHKLYGLPIDRENNRAAVKTILTASEFIKNKKASVAVFPEGYTSKSCELLPFRNGSFKIALKSNAPIVVCTLSGTRNIPKRMFLRKTEVEFCIVDVLYPEDFNSMSTVELGDKIHLAMQNSLKK